MDNPLSEIVYLPFTFSAAFSLLISFVLLALSGLISASEVAFFSISPEKLHHLEESDDSKDKNVLRILESPQKLLAGILIGNNFVNVSIILILSYTTQQLIDFSARPLIGFLFQTILITFILLLFGEIIPKIFATHHPLQTVRYTCKLQFAMQRIFDPIITLLINSTSFVNKKLIRHGKNNISMDELSHALELTSDKNEEDTEILEGIIKFGNIQVVDIMTSRVDIFMLDIKTNFKTLLENIIIAGYSRVPIYTGNKDNIKGILYSKDLLAHIDKPSTFRWQSLIRQAYYVPETKMIDDLLSEFQKNRVHLALVVDEYGGTSGLITLEDILEEIVGDINDEYDEDESLFTKIDPHTYIFDGKILLNDFFKLEEINSEDFEKVTEDVESLAGLILELKGEIPKKGEKIDFDKYVFEIVAVDNRRIQKIKLYLKVDED